MMSVARVAIVSTSSRHLRGSAARPAAAPGADRFERSAGRPAALERMPAAKPPKCLGLTCHLPLEDELQGQLVRDQKGIFVQLQLPNRSVHIPVQNSEVQGLQNGAPVHLVLTGRSAEGSQWYYRIVQPKAAQFLGHAVTDYTAAVCTIAQAAGGRAVFSAAALQEAEAAASVPVPNTVDLSSVPFVSLDPHVSLVCDQAFYIETHPQGDGLLLHYAVADASAWVPQGGAMDAEALARGASLHLPCRLPVGVGPGFPMLPPKLYLGGATLRAGKPCPAFVVSVHLSGQGEAKAYSLVRGTVRNRAELTYAQYEQLLQPRHLGTLKAQTGYADSLALLPQLARSCLQRSTQRGAWSSERDGVGGWNNQLSLLANEAVANYLALHQARAPYDVGYGQLAAQPQPHAVLKLPAYVHFTAPLRRYSDLATQRIVGALLANRPPPYQDDPSMQAIFKSCQAARQRQHTVDAQVRSLATTTR